MPSIRDKVRGLFRAPRDSVKPMREQGVAGFVVMGGYLQGQETSGKLVGRQRWQTALDILQNVSIVAASVRFMLNLVSRPDWSFEPADDSEEAKQYAELMEDMINDIDVSWTRIVRRAAMYRFHGFGVHEWVAKKRSDGLIGIASLEARPCETIERWDIDENGGIIGMWQRDPQTGAELYLPREKLMYLVDDGLTDRPDGMGWFRHLVDPAERLKSLLSLEAIGFERDLRGIPVGRAPTTELQEMVNEGIYTQDQVDDMIASLKGFVSMERKTFDTGIVLDSKPYENKTENGTNQSSALLWDLDLLTGDPGSLEQLDNAIKRLQTDMAMIMGTEVILVGRDGQGARALSEDKSRNLYLNGNAILADMAEAVDRDITPRIWSLNGFPEELMPSARSEDVAFKNAKEAAETLADMAQAGAVLAPDDPAFDDIRSWLGLPAMTPIDPEMLAALSGRADPNAQPDTAETSQQTQVGAQSNGQSTTKAAPRTLYVERKLLNAPQLIAWAKNQGFAVAVPPEEMHVTIAHSKVPLDWMKANVASSRIVVPEGGPRIVEPLGDGGAIVLLFRSPELEARHAEICAAGAVWNFPTFQPHVTITYQGAQGVDLSKIEPFTDELEFGPELFREMTDGWTDDLIEKNR